MDNIEELRDALLRHNPILFLGAGFSLEGKNKYGEMPKGDTLKQEIYDKFVKSNLDSEEQEEVYEYNLSVMCGIVNEHLNKGYELKAFLIDRLKNVEPAEFHMLLPEYPWKRIYTVNIDDLVENIYEKVGKDILVQNKKREKDDYNKLEKIEYIKLHGCVNEPDEDFIFSEQEYADLISSQMNFKLNNLVLDIQKEYFIFVGASLEERDIEYYIRQYEKAGYIKKGKIFFINPEISLRARVRIESFGGKIIEWKTKDFLEFVKKLNYKPDQYEKLKCRMNYAGIFFYHDLISAFTEDVYESRLYEGYNSTWTDVVNGWLFEVPVINLIKNKIKKEIYGQDGGHCIAIYGRSFVGKDCILKLLAPFLNDLGYQVLVNNGNILDENLIEQFVLQDVNKRYAILIENASYYYKKIERLLEKDWNGNNLLIIVTSRIYYHEKKKYYLEGNSFFEYLVNDKINRISAKNIYAKIKEKGYTGDLPTSEESAITEICKKNNFINLFSYLTYGKGFKKRNDKELQKIAESSEEILNLFMELAIFDNADLPYYPYELLSKNYSINFNIFQKRDVHQLKPEQRLIIDHIYLDSNGISLKNIWLIKGLLRKINKYKREELFVRILKSISGYVSEKEDNYWRMIFECLLKEEILERKFHFNSDDILQLYYKLKNDFENISYYWLQLGIAEQRKQDFSRALNHLKMARKIRPSAYQIQHAIARNYLKHANYMDVFEVAKELFQEGEKEMKALIYSDDNNKNKARKFSVHCYIYEKIEFIKKHNLNPDDDELLDMKRIIDLIIDESDISVDDIIKRYVDLLKMLDRMSILSMRLNDRYFKAYHNSSQNNMIMDSDRLIDSF